MFKKNNFHWLVTTVFYQQIENSERANGIHRFTVHHCKFILIGFIRKFPYTGNMRSDWLKQHALSKNRAQVDDNKLAYNFCFGILTK